MKIFDQVEKLRLGGRMYVCLGGKKGGVYSI